MRGVTLATYSSWLGRQATKDELRNIPDKHLQAIYRGRYWDVVSGDSLPYPLALVTFDAAVNSGPRRGAEWLQRALRVTADGKIGPMTVQAASVCDVTLTVRKCCDLRLTFLRSLPTWPTFGKGWSKRVEHVQTAALGP